jgi:uracil phosphoribosyltransferase
MNITRFINELLDEHDYVIVPGLGAFGYNITTPLTANFLSS